MFLFLFYFLFLLANNIFYDSFWNYWKKLSFFLIFFILLKFKFSDYSLIFLFFFYFLLHTFIFCLFVTFFNNVRIFLFPPLRFFFLLLIQIITSLFIYFLIYLFIYFIYFYYSRRLRDGLFPDRISMNVHTDSPPPMKKAVSSLHNINNINTSHSLYSGIVGYENCLFSYFYFYLILSFILA